MGVNCSVECFLAAWTAPSGTNCPPRAHRLGRGCAYPYALHVLCGRRAESPLASLQPTAARRQSRPGIRTALHSRAGVVIRNLPLTPPTARYTQRQGIVNGPLGAARDRGICEGPRAGLGQEAVSPPPPWGCPRCGAPGEAYDLVSCLHMDCSHHATANETWKVLSQRLLCVIEGQHRRRPAALTPEVPGRERVSGGR